VTYSANGYHEKVTESKLRKSFMTLHSLTHRSESTTIASFISSWVIRRDWLEHLGV